MTEHRVPMRRGSHYVDPAHSGDPAIRTIVQALARVDPAPAVRPEFRTHLRAQLVAAAVRTAPDVPRHAMPERSAVTIALRRRLRRIGGLELGRPARALAGAAAVLILLAASAVLLSRGALPGDALYGVKRASEQIELAATSGALDRGELELTFAGRRIGEAISLVAVPPASTSATPVGASAPSASAAVVVSSRTASLIDSTLRSADADVRAAARLLGGAAVRQGETAALLTVLDWLPAELSAVQVLLDRLAPGPVRERVALTSALLERAELRAEQLLPELGCACLDSAATDALGPVPCRSCTAGPAPSSVTPSPSASGASAAGSAHASGTAPPASTGTATSPHAASSQSTAPGRGPSSAPGSGSRGASASPGSSAHPGGRQSGRHGGTRTRRPPSRNSSAPGSPAVPRPTSSAAAPPRSGWPSLPLPSVTRPIPTLPISPLPISPLPIPPLPVPLPSLDVTLPALPGPPGVHSLP